jgi:hypothetical protein
MIRLLWVLLLCVSALAQDASFFRPLRWRNIGPLRGGRSIAVAGSAARPLEYYFGATGGGLWKTTDGGTSWNPVSDSFFETSSVGAVAVVAFESRRRLRRHGRNRTARQH